jgi:TP901-1 family phage major tail protein
MAAQRGRDMLIKIKDAQGTFVTVAGLRTKSLKFNAKTIDITHSESEDAWQELLPGSGIKSVEISGDGIFCDKASDEIVRTNFLAQSADIYQMVIPGFGVVEGDFLITNLNYAGNYDGEASYDLTLNSAGKTTFTPL